MKKVLLGIALVSSLAMAEGFVVEPKIGFDLTNHKIKSSAGNLTIKRGITLGLEVRKEDPMIEVGGGIDVVSRSIKKGQSFSSVPVYATAKYKFNETKGITPYVTGKIGYAFNKAKNPSDAEAKLKVGNGVYFGIGAGANYDNWDVSLGYSGSSAKATVTNKDATKKHTQSPVGFGAITLNVGYNFKF